MLFNKELYFYRKKNKSEMCAKCFFTFHSHVTLSQTPMFTWAVAKLQKYSFWGQPLKDSSTLLINEVSKMNFTC